MASSTFGDDQKGGGFAYAASIILIEKYPLFDKKLREVNKKYNLAYCSFARTTDRGHSVMVGVAFH